MIHQATQKDPLGCVDAGRQQFHVHHLTLHIHDYLNNEAANVTTAYRCNLRGARVEIVHE